MDEQKDQGQPMGDQSQPMGDAAADARVGSPPGPYWNQVVNSPPGGTFVTVPQPGNLWVFYECQEVPPQQIGVWHQGGTITQIVPGENNIAVGPGDALYYVLVNPATDSIKLAYAIG